MTETEWKAAYTAKFLSRFNDADRADPKLSEAAEYCAGQAWSESKDGEDDPEEAADAEADEWHE